MKILILEDSNEKYMALVRVLKRCGEIEHLGGHVQFCGLSAVAMCHTHLNERWKILTGEDE